MTSFTTPKGTELPIMKIKGKDYLEVKYRLIWFREEHPDWSIESRMMSVTANSSYARATIRDDKGRIIAQSHKFENSQGFPDFIEKSETGAIGRALALIGYGTQFCADELDEKERVVDSPVQAKAPIKNSTPPPPPKKPEVWESQEDDYVIPFGRKYKGQRLKDLPKKDVAGYIAWLDENPPRSGTAIHHEIQKLKEEFEKLFK